MGNIVDHQWIAQMAEVLLVEIVEQMSGICLRRCAVPQTGLAVESMDGVYGLVDGDYQMQMMLRADFSMFYRLAEKIIGGPPQDQREVEEYATEFFNILCGRFVSELHEFTGSSARFFPTRYERPPNVTSFNEAGAVNTLYLISEENEVAMFSWTAASIDNLLRRSRNGKA